MADKKITELQQVASITDGLSYPVDNGTQSYRATALQLFNYLISKLPNSITTAMLQAASVTDEKTSFTPPKRVAFTASGTYTPTPGVKYIKIRAVGGGGGGGGGGNPTPTGGGTGGTTTIVAGAVTLISCLGGAGGFWASSPGGIGGSATITAPAFGRTEKGNGGGGATGTGNDVYFPGGIGGNGPFGGRAGTGGGNVIAEPNSGSGGAGGAAHASGGPGGGGGAGGSVDAQLNAPLTVAATFAVTIGAGGAAGVSNNGANAPGSGGSGFVEIWEHFH